MRVDEQVPLARYTTIGTGGPARAFARPRTRGELREALGWARERDLAVVPIGLGSNVLVADAGVDALVLRLEGELAVIEVEGMTLRAGGGASWAVCIHRAREAGLGGIEFSCAIPGTIGGGVKMNAGAYGSDTASVLRRALVVSAGGEEWRTPAELRLGYRSSALAPGEVVALAELTLVPRDPVEVKREISRLNAERKAAQPTNRRTFGSVFANPEHELTAGRMLEACGLKGYRIGGACISPVHANFIENEGGATSADVVALMAEARRRALERFGVELRHEVQFLGPIALPSLER